MDLKFIESGYDTLCLTKGLDDKIGIMVVEDEKSLIISTKYALFDSIDQLIQKLQELKEQWK
jgi:hypothetical protein